MIDDFSASAPNSHLSGGMTYSDVHGKLTVPMTGRYYVYAQIYYHNPGRVLVVVGGKVVTYVQPPVITQDTGALYVGGVFKMNAGDDIVLKVGTYPAHVNNAKIYMWSVHSYFGAFLI